MSNYHSFGNMKFVPNISLEKFKTILRSHPHIKTTNQLFAVVLDKVLPDVEKEIYALEKPYT